MRFRQLLFALADNLHVVEEIEESLFAETGGSDGGHFGFWISDFGFGKCAAETVSEAILV